MRLHLAAWLLAAALIGRPAASRPPEPANNEKPFASMLNSAVINGKVSLACDISPASADDSVALILWYKDDSLAPIYTIDARKASSLDKAKMSFDEAYANRASFNMKSKPAQLLLEPIRQEDEGDYRCRVDFKRGRTVNTIISLRVVSLPDEIRIVTPQRPHTKLEGHIGPFNEGSELTLVCLAQGGKPRPQISWRRDFNVIDETYQHVDKDGTSNELKIPALNKNHLLSIFTCQASNNNLTSPMQTSITLDLNLKPQEVSLKLLGQEPLIVGQTSTFECITHGSRPQATIHWLFQGIRHDTPMNVDQQQTSSRLTLSLQRNFNQQTLTCVAENPRIGESSAIRQSIKLDVHYPPQLAIRLEPQSSASSSGPPPGGGVAQTGALVGSSIDHGSTERDLVAHLQEGNDIYLTCQMDANPRPIKPILWRFNGKPLAQLAQQQLLQQQQQLPQASNLIVMNNQSLVLRKVSRQQSGSYTCDASNQHGSNTSKPLDLLIRHAPVCATDDLLIFQAAIGQTVTIDCNVRANPAKSVQYSWFMAPEETNLTSWFQREAALDEQVDESSSRLRLKIKDHSSFGLIKCKAKNEVGLQQRACIFQVQATPPPSLRHDCTMQNATATSVQIECHPNEHLKSEEFEIVGGRPDHLGASAEGSGLRAGSQHQQMGDWLNFDKINRQTSSVLAESQTVEGSLGLNARLVYPPDWLLSELYKQTGDGPDDKNHELIAYVVVGSSQRLANIKSIVEDSRVFSANPKKVYYVAARPVTASERAGKTADDLPGSSAMLSNLTAHRSDNNSKDTEQEDPLAASSIQRWPNFAGNSREDPSIRLPGAFVFNVPSLEPASKYRLHIYGQNLANKTSDWLPVKAETLLDSAESNNQRHPQGANLLTSRSSSSSDQPDDSVSSHQQQQQQQQQKSIVMRSDSDPSGVNDQQSDGSGIEAHQQFQYPRSLYQLSSALGLGDRLQQIGLYKSNIITYAKQRPLMASLMALMSGLVMVLVFAWTGNRLIHLIRPTKRGSSRRRQLSSLVQDTGEERYNDNGSNSSSGHSEDNKQQQPESELTDDIKLIKANGRQLQQSSLGDNWSCSGQQDNHNHHLIVGHNSLQLMKHSGIGGTTGKVSGVYSIEEGFMQRPGGQESGLMNGHYVTQGQLVNQMHAARFATGQSVALGSLDRREQSNQQQQIYQLAANGTLLELHQHEHLVQDRRASIEHSKLALTIDDKSNGYGHHQLLVSAADLVDQIAGGTIDTSHGHEIYLQSLPGELAMCNHNGSFSASSVECNSSVDHQQLHQLQQQQQLGHYGYAVSSSSSSGGISNHHNQHNFRQQPRSRHKVAFDLGNQTAGQSRHLCTTGRVSSANGARLCDTYANSSSPNESSVSARQRLNGDREKSNGATGKGSDSGGSNSGATADSGHDSPATGETTTSACSNGQLQHRRNCPAKMGSTYGQPAGTTSPRLSPIGANGWPLTGNGGHGTTSDNGGITTSDNGNTNLVMLMELSPGSHESSTLLQSVDSYGSEQQRGQACPMLNQLQNNHQMATSFTSSVQTSGNRVNETSPEDPSHWL